MFLKTEFRTISEKSFHKIYVGHNNRTFLLGLIHPLDTECVDLDLIEIEMPEMEENDQECLDPDAY